VKNIFAGSHMKQWWRSAIFLLVKNRQIAKGKNGLRNLSKEEKKMILKKQHVLITK